MRPKWQQQALEHQRNEDNAAYAVTSTREGHTSAPTLTSGTPEAMTGDRDCNYDTKELKTDSYDELRQQQEAVRDWRQATVGSCKQWEAGGSSKL